MMKELLIGPSERVDTFICQESFRRVKKKKKNPSTVVKRRHYYDNSLIFKVTKGAGLHMDRMGPPPAPPPLAAIWTVLIVFYADHFRRSIRDLWKCCSYNVTSSGPAHERNISERDEKAARQYTASQHNY